MDIFCLLPSGTKGIFLVSRPQSTAISMKLLRRSVDIVRESYHPAGINLGMNLGKCAGAGVEDHLHWHIVPRWEGDNNFMPVLAETRVMPQHLLESYEQLKPYFQRLNDATKRENS